MWQMCGNLANAIFFYDGLVLMDVLLIKFVFDYQLNFVQKAHIFLLSLQMYQNDFMQTDLQHSEGKKIPNGKHGYSLNSSLKLGLPCLHEHDLCDDAKDIQMFFFFVFRLNLNFLNERLLPDFKTRLWREEQNESFPSITCLLLLILANAIPSSHWNFKTKYPKT